MNPLKMKFNMSNVLQNRIILYLFFFVSIVDLFYLATVQDFTSISTFLIIGFLSSFFSKNMIVILAIALCITHILKYGTDYQFQEGAQNMDDDDSSAKNAAMKTAMASLSKESGASPSKKTKNDSHQEENDIKKEYVELTKELKEFKAVQDQIIEGIARVEPILSKAESFMEKYQNYKENLNNKDGFRSKYRGK
jgi:hypothetical protein